MFWSVNKTRRRIETSKLFATQSFGLWSNNLSLLTFESFITEFAGIRSFARVRSYVAVEILLEAETFAANGAFERLGLQVHQDLYVNYEHKEGTLKWFNFIAYIVNMS